MGSGLRAAHDCLESEEGPLGDLLQVGYSAIVFYGYVGLIGLGLWAMLKWWFSSDVNLAQVWCIYGAQATHLSPVHQAQWWPTVAVAVCLTCT